MEKPVRPVEVFLSYAHKDEVLKDSLSRSLRALEDERLIRLWQDREISAGKGWKDEIDEHLKKASLILLLVSPDFLASEYCRDIENRLAREQEEKGRARIVPIILRPCDWQRTQLGQFQALPQSGKPVSEWADQSAGFRDVVAGIRTTAEEVREELSGVQLPPVWNVPYLRNPKFTGRRELLRDLHAALASGRAAAVTQAIHGLGGVGKTQLALEYAYRHARDYRLVWWLRAEEPGTLVGDYADLARILGLPLKQESEQALVVSAVRNWLDHNHNWLLVFDNAGGPDEVAPYLPRARTGHVIITSRNANWQSTADAVSVAVMTPEEATALLSHRTGQDDRKVAALVAEELGYLPLALEQASAYVETTGISLDAYLTLFRTRRDALWQHERSPMTYPDTIRTTWVVGIEKVRQESQAASDFLSFCAFLAPDDVPLDCMATGREALPDPLRTAAADELNLNALTALLRRYSLVTLTAGKLSVHRLVQAVTRDRLSESGAQSWILSAVRFVLGALPSESPDAGNWKTWDRLLSHGLSATAHADAWRVSAEPVGQLLRRLGGYLHDRGRFDEATGLIERSLIHLETVLGTNDPQLAELLHDLAWSRNRSGQQKRDLSSLQRALDILDAALGQGHVRSAPITATMAMFLSHMGRAVEAEPLARRALAIREKAFGLKHPDVASSTEYLGEVLWRQGRVEDAEQCFRRSLEIREEVLGKDHADTAESLQDLAVMVGTRGRWIEAEQLARRAVEVRARYRGWDDFTLARFMGTHARTLGELGRDSEAWEVDQKALEIVEKSLGRVNWLTPRILAHQGRTAQRLGKYAEAEKLRLEALEIQEQADSSDHQFRAGVLDALAQLYRETGREEQARECEERAKELRKK